MPSHDYDTCVAMGQENKYPHNGPEQTQTAPQIVCLRPEHGYLAMFSGQNAAGSLKTLRGDFGRKYVCIPTQVVDDQISARNTQQSIWSVTLQQSQPLDFRRIAVRAGNQEILVTHLIITFPHDRNHMHHGSW